MSKNEYIVKVEEHLHCWMKIKADCRQDAESKALKREFDELLGLKDKSFAYNVVKKVPNEYRLEK